jgi:hypothetical protein
MGPVPPGPVASQPYVEEDRQAQEQRPQEARQPRHQAQRGSLSATAPPPPPTRRDDTAEVLHGVTVPDPYQWLEHDDDPEVTAWVRSQNAHTDAVLGALPGRARLHRDLSSLLRAGS